jgi:hypothetical protein
MSGRQETAADRPLIEHASKAFRSSGFNLKEALVELAVGWEFLPEGEKAYVANH